MRTVPLICAALVLLGCADVEYGVAVDGERLPVIDMHLHPGEWSNTPPDTQEFLAGRFPFPLQLTPARLAGQVLSVDGLKEELDGAGIGTGVLFAVYAPRTVGISANEDVIADVKQAPDRFYGLASLRVERWNQDEASELQRLRDALGQPGMVGVKLAHAMGAHVVAFTTSESKREAAKALGADEVVNSRNADEMAAHLKSFDFILNTVAAPHNLDDFTTLLKRDGTMTLVGAPATPHKSPEVFNLIMKRRAIAGSMIGGIPETQEMLDFCAEHGIVADIEMIRADQINEAYERMLRGDVKYRFVIDNRTLTD